MEGGSRRQVPAPAAAEVAALPDELLVEIIARLPAKSICRCKCVSRAWRALISDPANRRRFAQTLSGLFFARPHGSRPSWGFIGLSMSSVLPPPPGVDVALSFLPPTCGEMELLDSCNGLLLLRCEDLRELPSPPPFYVVCNPATGDWIVLPQPSRVPGLLGYSMDTSSAALGFDPSISPHFHVFQLVQALDYYEFTVQAVEIYSSQTGRWVLRKTECSDTEYVQYIGQMTYFSGFLHFCMIGSKVVSVDTEGKHGGSLECSKMGVVAVVLLSVILRDAYFMLRAMACQVRPCQSMFLRIMTVRSGYGSLSKASTSQIYLDQEYNTDGTTTPLHFIRTVI